MIRNMKQYLLLILFILKESEQNLANVLEKIKYNEHSWLRCEDLKVFDESAVIYKIPVFYVSEKTVSGILEH